MTQPAPLSELPAPKGHHSMLHGVCVGDYTADQMREFAAAATPQPVIAPDDASNDSTQKSKP